MILFEGGFAVIAFAVWIFCIIDVITTPPESTRNLPKMVWLLLVIVLVDLGSIAWLVAGRPWVARANGTLGSTVGGHAPRPPAKPLSPDDDEEFLAHLRARAEEQRRRAREANRDDPGSVPPA